MQHKTNKFMDSLRENQNKIRNKIVKRVYANVCGVTVIPCCPNDCITVETYATEFENIGFKMSPNLLENLLTTTTRMGRVEDEFASALASITTKAVSNMLLQLEDGSIQLLFRKEFVETYMPIFLFTLVETALRLKEPCRTLGETEETYRIRFVTYGECMEIKKEYISLLIYKMECINESVGFSLLEKLPKLLRQISRQGEIYQEDTVEGF